MNKKGAQTHAGAANSSAVQMARNDGVMPKVCLEMRSFAHFETDAKSATCITHSVYDRLVEKRIKVERDPMFVL